MDADTGYRILIYKCKMSFDDNNKNFECYDKNKSCCSEQLGTGSQLKSGLALIHLDRTVESWELLHHGWVA